MKTAKRNTALAEKTQTTLLDKYKNVQPEGGLPIYNFEKVGDAIGARFLKRRQVKTKNGGLRMCVDCDILECSDGVTVGPHTIFESTHLSQIFDSNALNFGDVSICGCTRFSRITADSKNLLSS
jgi:hypothetical protein